MALSIIIVSWNVKKLLKQCLNSIYQYTKEINFEIFVVDNNSQDQTVTMVKKCFPQVKIIANQKNLGFAKANNQAIKKAQGNYILLLNPDTEIKENSFKKMIEFLKKYPKVGILGPKLTNTDGSVQQSVRSFPTICDQALILLKIHCLFPKFKCLKQYFKTDFDYQKTQIVDQVMGACFLIKKQVLSEIGILDPGFYIWFEEVDFCKRAQNAGWKIMYFAQTAVIHYFGQSFKQMLSLRKQKIWNQSLQYYFLKHHSFAKYLILVFLGYPALILSYLIEKVYQKK